jgi:hypothetical protein
MVQRRFVVRMRIEATAGQYFLVLLVPQSSAGSSNCPVKFLIDLKHLKIGNQLTAHALMCALLEASPGSAIKRNI